VTEAVHYSEESRTKCIGLTIETRPDYCLTPHLTDMLSYGCTRLEIGIQVRLSWGVGSGLGVGVGVWVSDLRWGPRGCS